jgi:ligand-binding SRPBCC domain-containing protein
MMRHSFRGRQWVPYPVEQVFAFFADPANLPRLMPQWQRARIEQSNFTQPPPPPNDAMLAPGQAVAGKGSTMIITFQALPFLPIRMKWEAIITDFHWNESFCDEQPKGPFAYWRHCHRVSRQRQGTVEGTEVLDDLIYALPFGIVSEPAHAIFVRRQIEGIFSYRQNRLLELLA